MLLLHWPLSSSLPGPVRVRNVHRVTMRTLSSLSTQIRLLLLLPSSASSDTRFAYSEEGEEEDEMRGE